MKTTKRGMELSAYPKNSKKQDPYQELDEIFDYAHIDELEILLWEWLKTTVSGSFHKELTRSEKVRCLPSMKKCNNYWEPLIAFTSRHKKCIQQEEGNKDSFQ